MRQERPRLWMKHAAFAPWAISLVVGVLGMVLAAIGALDEESGTLVFTISLVLWQPLLPIAVAWTYDAWQTVPPASRRVSPETAVVLSVIPGVNLVWMFVGTLFLCRGIDDALARAGRQAQAPVIVGMIAAALTLIPGVNAILAVPAWYVFWIHADRARDAIAPVDAHAIARQF